MAKKPAKSIKASSSSASSASSASAQTNAEPVSKDKMVLRPRSQGRQSVSSSEMEEIPKSAVDRKLKLKKKIVKVDAKKPKKPPTAFFYFLEDFRKEFQEQNPDVKKMRDIGKACGVKWKTMTYEEKVKYYDIATEKRAEFDRATAEYIRKKESGEDDKEAEDEDSEFDL